MKMLAVETSEAVGTVAALEAGQAAAEVTLPPHQRSAQSLAPTLRALLRQLDWRPTDVQLMAVSIGPGSFTGLRVGVTTAKTFAYATGANIVAVGTLEVVAARAPRHATPLWAAIDAQRQQVFVSHFDRLLDDRGSCRGAVQLMDIDRWLSGLQPGDWLTGPALRRYAGRVPATCHLVELACWPPTAAAVGRVGWQRFQAGQRDRLWELVPNYVRRSAAEELRRADRQAT